MRFAATARLCLGFAAAGWGAALAAQASATPDFSRYQVILDRKPFGEIAPLAAAAEAGPVTAASFAKDYEMKGIIDDGDTVQVAIMDKQTKKHIYLQIGQEINGIRLVSADYDKEEAELQMGGATTLIKFRPDTAPALASATNGPLLGAPGENPGATAGVPFMVSEPAGGRVPFFTRRRGESPFRRLGTNPMFQAKSLESFFRPNTNLAKPFVSPFRPEASPFQPVSPPDAEKENPGAGLPFAPPSAPSPDDQVVAPSVQSLPAPMQVETVPLEAPVVYDGFGEVGE